MAVTTKHRILQSAKRVYALHGYEGLSMRTLAKESSVGLSSIYHFFEDKDVLLSELFKQVSDELEAARQTLPQRRSAKSMLDDSIRFQFDNIENYVFMQKYFLHFRPQFLALESGYTPLNSYIHIESVVRRGIETGEFESDDPTRDAKLIVHIINGYLLEYYPDVPTGRDQKRLIDSLTDFILRAIAVR